MLRRRRVRLVVLLFALLGAGGGYWLAHRDPDLVLRTVVLTGAQPRFFGLDEGQGRFYFQTSSTTGQPLSILNTRTGNPVFLRGALAATNWEPIVDHQSGHYFAGDASDSQLLMIDMHTDAALKAISLPSPAAEWAVDTTHDRIVLVFRATSDVLIVDGHSGSVLHDLLGCQSSTSVTAIAATKRILDLCGDGSIYHFDSQTYRLLRHTPPSTTGICASCTILVDPATKWLFITAQNLTTVLNAQTGFGAFGGGEGSVSVRVGGGRDPQAAEIRRLHDMLDAANRRYEALLGQIAANTGARAQAAQGRLLSHTGSNHGYK